MAKLNPYLNFDGTCEEAFNFYKSVFGGEFKGGIFRMGDIEGAEIPEGERDLVMHVSLPIGNDILMGSDVGNAQRPYFKSGKTTTSASFPTAGRKPTASLPSYRKGAKWRCPWKISSGVITSEALWIDSVSTG